VFYEALISDAELRLLSALIGEPLSITTPIVWSVQLSTPKATIGVNPDEILTPDKEHPRGTVDRIMITMDSAPPAKSNFRTSNKNLGKVREVEIVSTVVAFSPVRKFPPQDFLGTTLPASTGYGYIYYHPLQLNSLNICVGEEDALVLLDMGIKFVTDRHPSVFLFTRGYFVNAVFDALPDEDWAMSDSFECCSLRERLDQGLKRSN